MGWRSSTATPQTIISAWSTRLSLNSQPTVLAPQTTILILELFNIYRMIERIDRLKTTEIRPLTRLSFYVLWVFFFLALQEVISASVLALRETDAPAEIVVWLLILPLSCQWARNRKWCISIKDLPSHTVRLSPHRGASWWCTPPILHSYWMSL